jgi:phosphopantetheinyl transferase
MNTDLQEQKQRQKMFIFTLEMKQVFYKNIAKESHLYVWKVQSSALQLLRGLNLSGAEIANFAALKTEKRKVEFLACRIALKNLFTEELILEHFTSGKPFIKEAKHLSISHSHNYIAIAFGETEVGIDIEKAQEKMLRLISRVLSEQENKMFLQNPSIELACKLWGAKESVLKYIGDRNINYREDIILNENSASYLGKEFNIYYEDVGEMILSFVSQK